MPFFNLSALASLTTVVTEGITGEFKKLLQPPVLLAAAVFLALHLVLLFPLLHSHEVGFALWLAALAPGWQATLATLALLLLAYLVASLDSYFLHLLSGTSLARSPLLGGLLLWRQRRAFEALRRTAEDPQASEDDKARAAYRLAYGFPDDEQALAPTTLGNVLLSVSSYTRRQYGAHLDTLWPLVSQHLKSREALQSRLTHNQTALGFLTALCVLVSVVALELALAALALWRWRVAWPLPILLFLAGIFYVAAEQKARAWGRDVRLAFDLCLEEVASALRLRELPAEATQQRKARWEEVSRWLAYGALVVDGQPVAAPDSAWYAPPAAAPPSTTVKASVGLRVQEHTRVLERDTRLGHTTRVFGQVLECLFAVSSEESLPVSGAFLHVTDTRMKSPPEEVSGLLLGAGRVARGETVLGRECPEGALLWPLGELPARGSVVLRYMLRLQDEVIAEVAPETCRLVSIEALDKATLQLTLELGDAPAPVDVQLTVTARQGRLPEEQASLTVSGKALPAVKPQQIPDKPQALSWSLSGIEPRQRIEFALARPK